MALFTNLTDLFGAGPIRRTRYAGARRKSVIDCVRDDLNNLMRVNMSRVGQEEALRLGRASHQTGKIVTAQCSADTATKLGLTTGIRAGGHRQHRHRPLEDRARHDGSRGAHGDLRRQPRDLPEDAHGTSLQVPGRSPLESHSLSHRIGNAGMGGACVANAIDMIHAIDK